MNTYLSEDNIKRLKNHINKVLPARTRATLLNIKLKTGIELYYENIEKNKQVFWKYVNDEIYNQNNQLSADFKAKLNKGSFTDAGEILKAYLQVHYKDEWRVINEFNPMALNEYMNGVQGVLYENKVQYTTVKELIECQDINDFIDERYSIKAVDKEALKKSQAIIKAINELYKDVENNSNEYWKLKSAIDIYLTEKNEQLFHNILNYVQD